MALYIVERATLLILFLLMAFLSAVATAYVAVDVKEIEEDIKDKKSKNNKKAKKISQTLKTQSKFVKACEMGIVFCELSISAYSVEVFAIPIYAKIYKYLDLPEYIVKYFLILSVTFVVTYLLFIFAHLLPKHIAIKHPKKITYATIDLVYILSKIFSPFMYIIHATDNLFVKMFSKTSKEKRDFTDLEIKTEIELKKEDGLISKEGEAILNNIVNLNYLLVKDIMKPIEKVICVNTQCSKNEIIEIFKESTHSILPIYDRDIDNILGAVNIKKVFYLMDNKDFKMEKIITPVVTVTDKKKVSNLLKEMKKEKIKLAVITSENKKVIGIVTLQDIMNAIIENVE
ncbi:MAG: CNNM domain-containing protein [Clostridia bacterium]